MKKILLLFAIMLFVNYVEAQTTDTTLDALKKITQSVDSSKAIIKIELQKKMEADSMKLKKIINAIEKAEIDKKKNASELAKLDKEKNTLNKSIDSSKQRLNKQTADSIAMAKAIAELERNIDTLKKTASKIDSTNKKDLETNGKIKDSIDIGTKMIQKVQDLLDKTKDSLIVISEVAFLNSRVLIHTDTTKTYKQNSILDDYGISEAQAFANDTAKPCKISSIKIRIKEGQILTISIFTNKGVFRNKKCPISLTSINEERQYDKMFLDGINAKEFLYLKDVIKYTPVRSYNYIPYADIEFTLNKTDSIYFLKESTSINFYVDVAAYTDLKGIAGDANGLAQFNMSGKFITNTKNKINRPIIPFNYVSIEAFIAKFDNSFKGVLVDSNKVVDRNKLFQTSYYKIGAKVNLFHWVLSPYPTRLIEDMQLNLGYNFVGAKTLTIKDRNPGGTNKIYDSTYTNVTHNQWYVEPIVRFVRNSNFGFSISCPLIYQSLKASSNISNAEDIWYANPTIGLSYFSKATPSNKLFFRYSYYINLRDKENAFVQAQVGYAASLSEVFSSTKESKTNTATSVGR